jgi:23S rRNA pseudouridine1911/1915/1917 synthase
MLEPTIIYETKDVLGVNKPAGLMVHGVRRTSKKHIKEDGVMAPVEPTLVDWLIKRYPEIKTVGDDPELRPGIVHRLDKDTSGVMLVAKTQESFLYLKGLFQAHEIRKTYYAVVVGILKKTEGTIDAPIGIVNGTLKRSIRSNKMRKEAITEYSVIKEREEKNGLPLSLLEVHPLTGRTHQIRVHLASIGHPILGDKLYGNKKNRDHRLMLHAGAIEFKEREGGMVRIEAPAPKEFSFSWLSTD